MSHYILFKTTDVIIHPSISSSGTEDCFKLAASPIDGWVLVKPESCRDANWVFTDDTGIVVMKTCGVKNDDFRLLVTHPKLSYRFKDWLFDNPAIMLFIVLYRFIPSLTHLPLDKMPAVSQTIHSSAFSWMKNFVFWLNFHWSLFPMV